MRIKVVSRDHWKNFFEIVSREVENRPIELEVANPEIGDQIEEEWTTLWGLTYDPKADVLTMSTENFDRWVLAPHQVYIREGGGQIDSLGIKDFRGNLVIIHFWQPQRLPPAREVPPRRW